MGKRRTLQFPEKWQRLAVVLFFLFLLAAGVVLHDDYGGFTDEFLHIQTAAMQYKQILSKVMAPDQIPEIPIFDLEALQPFEGYINRYYGEAVMLPTLFIAALPGVSLDTAEFLNFRRFYTFLNFWLALICFYQLLRIRFSNRLLAFAGMQMLLLTPRFFAESFYNCKDIVFFSWFLISLCGIAWYLLGRTKKGLVLFAFAAALTINTRIYGAALYAFLVLIVFFSELKADGHPFRKLKAPLAAILFSIAFYWLITPFLWENPIRNFFAGLTFASDQVGIDPLAVSSGKSLVRLGDAELFMGQIIAPRDVWYYIPVWIGITVPVIYLVLFGAGVIALPAAWVRKRRSPSEKNALLFDSFMLIWLVGITALIILSKATLYHGWRHVYFLYVFILYLSVYGLNELMQLKIRSEIVMRAKKIALFGVCLASFISTGSWIVRNHPLDFVYFNEIGRAAAPQFSRDYWGVASKKCVLDLLNEYDGRRVSLDLNADRTWGSIEFSLLRLPLKQQAKFDPVWKTENAEYACYSYKNTLGNNFVLEDFEPIHVYRVDGYDVAAVFKRVKNFKYQ